MITHPLTALPGLPRLPGLPGLSDPPLDPAPEEARDRLRQELARPEYHDVNWLERIQDWIRRRFDDGVGTAQDLPPVGTFAAIVVLLALGLAIAYLVSRARRTARVRKQREPALTDESLTAAQLRARAEEALAADRLDDAVVDAYRALALRQVERHRIEDLPQATAHELARALGPEFPASQRSIFDAADLFDAVLYGDRPATRQQALDVLALDEDLGGRPVRR